MTDVPKSHPRYLSLRTRDLIVGGVEKGVTSIHGLIAHGRGEAFDYLINEKTNEFAKDAIRAAAAMLLSAKNPVISVNGNFAALCAKEIAVLADAVPAKIEVNIFHSSEEREKKIREFLLANGAKEVLMPGGETVKFIDSNRKYCNLEGIFRGDVVFVPLEDGDRCEALIKMGKKVITVDLNPLSRTAQKASVTVVDNVVRVMPLLIKEVRKLKKKKGFEKIVKGYKNDKVLKKAVSKVKGLR